MRVTKADRTVTFEHTPGPTWLLGGLLVFLGAVFLVGTLGLTRGPGTLADWERLTVALFGCVALVAGGWLCWRAPRSHARLDLASGIGRVDQIGIGIRETIEVPLDVIDAVVLHYVSRGDRGDMFRPALQLRDGRLVLLSPVWMHQGPEETVQALGQALGRPVTRTSLAR